MKQLPCNEILNRYYLVLNNEGFNWTSFSPFNCNLDSWSGSFLVSPQILKSLTQCQLQERDMKICGPFLRILLQSSWFVISCVNHELYKDDLIEESLSRCYLVQPSISQHPNDSKELKGAQREEGENLRALFQDFKIFQSSQSIIFSP